MSLWQIQSPGHGWYQSRANLWNLLPFLTDDSVLLRFAGGFCFSAIHLTIISFQFHSNLRSLCHLQMSSSLAPTSMSTGQHCASHRCCGRRDPIASGYKCQQSRLKLLNLQKLPKTIFIFVNLSYFKCKTQHVGEINLKIRGLSESSYIYILYFFSLDLIPIYMYIWCFLLHFISIIFAFYSMRTNLPARNPQTGLRDHYNIGQCDVINSISHSPLYFFTPEPYPPITTYSQSFPPCRTSPFPLCMQHQGWGMLLSS